MRGHESAFRGSCLIPTPRLWQTVLAEPLLHFALLGGLLYGAYLGMRRPRPLQIVVPAELQEARRAELLRRNGRPPGEAEMAAALGDYVDAEETCFVKPTDGGSVRATS